MDSSKKVGLVLGGGGARGLAHIGVAKVLHEYRIQISELAGCSMGALIAALLAIGLSVDEIERIARRFNSKREIIKLLDRTPSRRGLLAGKSIRRYLSNFIDPEYQIEDALIPLTMNAVDLITGKEIALTRGNLLDGIMASTAIPGIFPPVEIGSYRLVDGGVLNDVPVKYSRKSSVDIVLAVDVHQYNHDEQPITSSQLPYEHMPLPLPVLVQDFYRVEMIITSELISRNLQDYPPDILITPSIPGDITALFGFTHVDEIIRAGEVAMREKMPDLLKMIV